MKLGPGLSCSWKRALGVTKAKRQVSKKPGIPLSCDGRQNANEIEHIWAAQSKLHSGEFAHTE